MADLHTMNLQSKGIIPFDTKLVADFPGYWYYQPMLKMSFKKFDVGLEYSYNSTGSRLSGKDYSGEYKLDMRINKKSPGIFFEYYVFSENNINVGLKSGAGMMLTSLSLKENLVVNNINSEDNSYNFKAKNYYYQPEVKAVYSLRSFELEFNVAYLVQIGKGVFYNEKDKNQGLSNQVTGYPLKPGWNGVKIGIGINYVIIGRRIQDEIHKY